MTLRRAEGGTSRHMALEVVTAQPARRGVGECESSSMEEVVVVGKQTVRQAARLAASQVQAKWAGSEAGGIPGAGKVSA
jgi:hypothetical protein